MVAHRKMRVCSHMTPSPHTIGRDQTLAKAHALMHENRIRHLPVLDGGTLVGVVSDRDLRLVESIAGTDPQKTRVDEAMTPEPFFVVADALVRDVAEQMVEHKYGCAVVTEHGHVVGIFTTIDAMRALLDLEREVAGASAYVD
jgi:acetoin utilization protein AcuB